MFPSKIQKPPISDDLVRGCVLVVALFAKCTLTFPLLALVLVDVPALIVGRALVRAPVLAIVIVVVLVVIVHVHPQEGTVCLYRKIPKRNFFTVEDTTLLLNEAVLLTQRRYVVGR